MVRTGGSYLSQSELPLTFGLQPGEGIDRLEIAWPSGAQDVFRGLHINRTFMAHEGDGPAPGLMVQPPIAAAVTPAGYPAAQARCYGALPDGALRGSAPMFEQVLQAQPADYIAQQYLIELYWRLADHEKARALLATMRQTLPDANFLMQFAFHLEEAQLH